MHIGFVTIESPYDAKRGGGIAAYLRAVIPALVERGHQISVFAASDQSCSFERERGKVRVYHFPLPSVHWYTSRLPLIRSTLTLPLRQLEWSLGFYWRIARLTNGIDLDVLECSESGALFLDRVAPLVIRLHGSEFVFRKYTGQPIDASVWLNDKFEIQACKRAAGVTTPSHFQAREAAERMKLALDRFKVIPNPISQMMLDVALQVASKSKIATSPVVLYTGRLAPVKGIDPLLKAIPIIRTSFPDATFVLAGPWQMPQPPAHWNLSLNQTSADGILWLGHLPPLQLVEWYRHAALAVVPSYYETFGISVIEAMAFGLPVVATTAGGLPEVAENGVTGILVPPGDPQALAEAIIRLLCDPDLRRRMGEAGRERVLAKFTVEQVVVKTIEVYDRVLRKSDSSISR